MIKNKEVMVDMLVVEKRPVEFAPLVQTMCNVVRVRGIEHLKLPRLRPVPSDRLGVLDVFPPLDYTFVLAHNVLKHFIKYVVIKAIFWPPSTCHDIVSTSERLRFPPILTTLGRLLRQVHVVEISSMVSIASRVFSKGFAVYSGVMIVL
jgi:hypothetical protein